jgi:hypothetical protein
MVRRIVTAVDGDRHVFLEVAEVEARQSNTNWFGIVGWDGWPRVPVDPGSQFVPTSSFPPRSIADGVRVSIAEFPPAHARVSETTWEASSDRMNHCGADGMHSTLTVDVAFVISGRIVLRQRDSAELELSPGGLRRAERDRAFLAQRQRRVGRRRLRDRLRRAGAGTVDLSADGLNAS